MTKSCPPKLKAALILDVPTVGMVVRRSRGNETTNAVCCFGSTLTTMRVSDRCPVSTDGSPKAPASELLSPAARESDPIRRKLAGSSEPVSGPTATGTRVIDESLSSMSALVATTAPATSASAATRATAYRPIRTRETERVRGTPPR
jgi:hypothetical protein